ncbi:MAG: hypothetical protein FJZ00_02305 [Candidatus Sericytochromatia bacterium]|uniref:Uncharacterized protein n=1 Tax=Candidatus Tanganyikabacteria bacterium TaxID=2961651 RepID=A0A937X292_9BACT|nr:hypothetical protein [Candidatus Tanganyikabacteria bacterium]
MGFSQLATGIAGLAGTYLLIVGVKFGYLRLNGRILLDRALRRREPPKGKTTQARITFCSPVLNPKMAWDILETGLDELDEPVERLLYLNTGDNALVAARLFNRLIQEVDTEYVAFCHQDWRPIDRDWVEETLAVFAANPRCGMVAQIGVAEDKESLGGRILDPHGYNGRAGSHRLHAPDEQCFVLRTATVREFPFDEANLPEFHYYAVDYAYELQRRGGEIWSTPALAYHGSAAGSLNSPSFKRARAILRAKYGPGAVRATTGWI